MKKSFDSLCRSIIQESYSSVDAEFDSREEFSHEIDDLDGKYVGRPDRFYSVILSGQYTIGDDSDYNRETGYGKYTFISGFEIDDLDVTEYNIHTLQATRENAELEKNVELYTKLTEVITDMTSEWLENNRG